MPTDEAGVSDMTAEEFLHQVKTLQKDAQRIVKYIK